MNRDDIPYYRPILMAIYGTSITAGIGFLINESPTMAQALNQTGYMAWTSLFIFGGTVGVGSVLKRWKPLEVVALLGLVGAVVTFIIAILFSRTLREQDGINFGMAGVLIITLLLICLRALVLHDQIRIRDKTSREILHDGQ